MTDEEMRTEFKRLLETVSGKDLKKLLDILNKITLEQDSRNHKSR